MIEKESHRKLFGNSPTGYTLIEALVVIAIIGIVSAIVFVDSRKGNENLALDRAASKLAQDIRRTAELAFQGKQATPCDSGGKSLSGYGIYFDTGESSYVLYAECSKDGPDADAFLDRPGFDPDWCPVTFSCPLAGGLPNERDIFLEGIELEEPVIIDSIIASGGTSWSLTFVPPDPTVFICKDGNGPCVGANRLASASVVLRIISDPSQTKTITVNEKGAIDID